VLYLNSATPGCIIDFSSAIWDDHNPVVQKIYGATASFDWHYTCEEAHLHAARLLAAYEKAFTKIIKFWESPTADFADPSFPDIREYVSLDSSVSRRLKYVGRFNPNSAKLLFIAHDMPPDNADQNAEPERSVLVKFTKRYGMKLHQFCAGKGFAPALYGCSPIGAGWCIVVMEYLGETYRPLNEVGSGVVKNLTKFSSNIQEMNSAGWVHGDVREPNVLCNAQGDLQLIDFDWGGLEEEQLTYPGDLNVEDIYREKTAVRGGVLRTTHDVHMLKVIIAKHGS
jgi:hypothetical protein